MNLRQLASHKHRTDEVTKMGDMVTGHKVVSLYMSKNEVLLLELMMFYFVFMFTKNPTCDYHRIGKWRGELEIKLTT